MQHLSDRENRRLLRSDEPGARSLSDRVRGAWWSVISTDPNDRISNFALVGVYIGVQWMLAGFAGFSIKPASPMWDQYTEYGKFRHHPDRDLPFYAFGSCLAVLLAITLERAWRRRSEPPGIKTAVLPGHRVALLLALVPTIPFWLNLASPSTILLAGGLRRSTSILLMMPGLAAAAAIFLFRGRPGLAGGWTVARAPDVPAHDGERQAAELAEGRSVRSSQTVVHWLFDVGMVALIASLIYIPDWKLIAYQTYNLDQFHHWDFYLMGPALGFFHGRALGTDVFSQYGVGWPVVLSWLSAVTPITYATCAAIFVLCGTLYFVLYYLTLRHVAGGALLAAAIFFVFLNLQLFHGLPDSGSITMWSWPSSSIVRSVFDLGFFAMLALHGRSGHSRWMVASSAMVGLGLLFEMDTGLYLLASFFYYLFVTWLHGVRGVEGPWSANLSIRTMASLAATLISVTAVGLLIASRGTLFSREFFEGWLEGVRTYGGGFSSLPVVRSGRIALAMLMVLVGLSIGSMLLPILRRRSGRMGFQDRYMGCWGSYAWCAMALFVNRSHPWNIFHCILPFGVLAAYLARSILDRSLEVTAGLGRSGSTPWRTSLLRQGAPGLALVVALIALWTNPAFRGYPNLWNRPVRSTSLGPELCLMPGLCGFPESDAEKIEEFRSVTGQMAEYRTSGQSIEIIHAFDPIFYLASGCPPLDRYSPLLPDLKTKQQLTEAIGRFQARKTPRVVIQEPTDLHEDWTSLREALSAYRNVLLADYEIEKRIGHLEIWRLQSTR